MDWTSLLLFNHAARWAAWARPMQRIQVLCLRRPWGDADARDAYFLAGRVALAVAGMRKQCLRWLFGAVA